MKRRQQENGPRGFSSEIYAIADAEVLVLTEGNIRVAAIARMPEAAGVSSPRHAFIRILQELGKTSQSPLALNVGEVVGGRGQPETADDGLRGILRTHSVR